MTDTPTYLETEPEMTEHPNDVRASERRRASVRTLRGLLVAWPGNAADGER